MKKSMFLLLVLLLTGCATFQVSTLNHDPIYTIEGSDAEINVINNEFELQRLLRTDFNFRFDFAQYALRQPRSFDWNNRVLGNRYNYYSPYGFGYNYYWNRTQMWNDWVWGFPYYQLHSWSYWGYNYYNWNNHLNPNWGRSYVNSNRKNTTIIRDRRAHASMIQSTKRTRVVTNKPRIRTKPRINYNTKPVIVNRRPSSNNNSRPIFNNSRPVINNNSRSNNNNRTRSNSGRKN